MYSAKYENVETLIIFVFFFIFISVNGNWEFFEPGIKIAPGQPVKYRVTAYRDDGTEQSEWISGTVRCPTI